MYCTYINAGWEQISQAIKVTYLKSSIHRRFTVMTQENAARFFKSIKEDQELQQKCKAITDAESFVKMAEQRGYSFTTEELEKALDELPPEEVAATINPGVGPRQHILPR
jgi:predicted ribosomally synthesized peptide with nif11-like leader